MWDEWVNDYRNQSGRPLCLSCRYCEPMTARVAGVLTSVLHCWQGVPGSPQRMECPVYRREPGADDE
jgi:hypothetical protein